MLNEVKTASGEGKDANQTEPQTNGLGVPEKKHSLVTPLLVVILSLLIVGAVGLGVYYYFAGVKDAQKTEQGIVTETPKSIEEQQLDSVQQDLDSTNDLSTSGVDADAAEIQNIDVSGAI